MAASPSVKSVSVELRGLSELRSALLEGIKNCSEAAYSAADQTLRKTILSLQQQSSQYLNEISSQIEALGGNTKDAALQQELDLRFDKEKNTAKGRLENKALKICRKIESSVISLYSKMLKEPFENNHLKEMIKYQMNGMMRTTLQLKLLSKFLHNQ